MKLFYTVISAKNVVQNKPSLSLGGFKSSSPLPNSVFNKLFPDISNLTLEKNLPEYIGIVLENQYSESKTNVKVWVEVPQDSLCKYRLSIVTLTSSGEMESVPSVNSKPILSDFSECTSEVDSFLIPSIGAGVGYGIWVERSLNTSSESFSKRNDCDFLYTNPLSLQSKEETITLKVKFD